jgi:hypothetical protein
MRAFVAGNRQQFDAARADVPHRFGAILKHRLHAIGDQNVTARRIGLTG